jgi:hypothetical protein
MEQGDDNVLLGFVLDQLVDSECPPLRELYQTDRDLTRCCSKTGACSSATRVRSSPTAMSMGAYGAS